MKDNKQLCGPPRRQPNEVWSGWGRCCILFRNGFYEIWELADMYANADNPENWRLVEQGENPHLLVRLCRWLKRWWGVFQ